MTEKELLIGEIKKESANTRIMLQRLEDHHLSWKPHEKSYATAALAQHIANIPIWISIILTTDGLDLAKPLPKNDPPTSASALMAFFEERLTGCFAALEKVDDLLLEKIWTLSNGDKTIVKAPKKIVIRYFALNHIVHHRGQLSVYLRLQDIPVPGMYGASADEK